MIFPLLPRKKFTDKSHYGHVLVLAGSRSMSGAGQLVSWAALSAGSGLVTVGSPRSTLRVFSKKALAEVMHLELPESSKGALSAQAYPKIISFMRGRSVNCLAIGPGLTHERGAASLVRKLVQTAVVPVVLDADGLNAFRGKTQQLKKHCSPLILTPHRKEFERLFSMDWPEKKSQRVVLAKKLSRSYDGTLVLKGHRTLVAQGNRVYENRTGNPGMAKGGSGDVLTGIIAAFVAQGLGPFEAACWGVHFHGRAGDLAVKTKGELSLLASDLIEFLPKAFKK